MLNADPSRLGEEVEGLEAAGADAIQWDVMDGHFVPNLTFGADVIKACRPLNRFPYEAHLMIENAERWIQAYVESGCETVIVHPEAQIHLHRTLEEIRKLGSLAGVALNPATSLEAIRHVLPSIDHLLIMTVNPGFGGQSYIADMEPKIAEARSLIDATGRHIPLEVDGGISASTIAAARRAGADTFVVGSALFRHPDGVAAAIEECRRALEEGSGQPAA
ncbi:MAG: ribulose-phosphate 3-epimerase [Actinomycetota bacterium]|nr:ribulose-phosphate 3-epimerase [Actinomycetota bacterium]